MGVDWRSIGWKEYQVMLAGWNARQDIEGPEKPPPDLSRLKRAMAAHTLQ